MNKTSLFLTVCLLASWAFMSVSTPALAGPSNHYDDTLFLGTRQAVKIAPPVCTPTQILTYINGVYSCVPRDRSGVTCPAGQVLTSAVDPATGLTAFTCLAYIPTCPGPERMTVEGGAFICKPFMPNCAVNEVLTSTDGSLKCTPVGEGPICLTGAVLTSDGTTLSCTNPPTCGDVVCTATGGEDCNTCPYDCGGCPPPPSGGGGGGCDANGWCGPGESWYSCPGDCPAFCGDGIYNDGNNCDTWCPDCQ